MRTFQQEGNNVAVYEDGKKVSTVTPDVAREMGYTPKELTLPQTPVNLPSLPNQQAPVNNLLSFKDSLEQVTNLARQKRNQASLQFMMPLRGTVAASDFNSILSNLNTASEKPIEDITKQLTAPNTFDTISDATGAIYQVERDATGKIVGQPTKVFSGKATGGEEAKLLSVTEAQALGVPYGTTQEQAYGITPTKPPTEAQNKDAGYASRAVESGATLSSMTDMVAKYNPATFAVQLGLEPTVIGNNFVSDTVRQVRQAERNFLNAVLRRESGAVISPSEFAEGAKQYFPRPGDDATTLAQKAQNRATVTSNFIRSAGSAYQAPTGGRIRVRLQDGQTGTVEAAEFDPATMTKI